MRQARRLPGASTAAVHRLDLADGSAVVLRRYVWRWALVYEPLAPQHVVRVTHNGTMELAYLTCAKVALSN